MTLVAAVKQQIDDEVEALKGRGEEVADLAELVRQGALPQRSPAYFVVPLGFDAQGGESVTGLFTQMLREVVGVLITVEALGDPKAKRAIAKVDELVKAVLTAVAGWAPTAAIGVLEPLRGRLVSVTSGLVIYQIDFALSDQLRIPR